MTSIATCIARNLSAALVGFVAATSCTKPSTSHVSATQSSQSSRSQEEALCPSYAPDRVYERRTSVPEWDVDLLECQHGPDESDALVTDVYISNGNRSPRKIADSVTGELVTLVSANKIFVCQDNFAMESTGPLLIDLSGKAVDLVKHAGTIWTCERTGNGEQVFIQYNDAESDRPFSIVRIFDSDGSLLKEQRFDEEGEIHFSVEGTEYISNVAKPAFPG